MLLIKKGRVIDPANKRDEIADVLIDDGKITAIEKEIPATKNMQVIEAKDYIVAPGLIDNHVHFRDPGLTYKEDLETGGFRNRRERGQSWRLYQRGLHG